MFRQTFVKRGALLASVTCGIGLVMAIMVAAQGTQRESTAKKESTQTKKEVRYAPTLAILMAAYEGVLKNDEKVNPKAVRALKQSFARNPSTRKTIDKLHKSYRAMSNVDREKMVGKDLVHVTGETHLTRATLEPVLNKHFTKRTAIKAQEGIRTIRADQMKAVVSDDKPTAAEAKTLVVDKPVPFKEHLSGAEPKEGHSTTYRLDYTGLYCQREPLDWGTHCEPAVMFTMYQSDAHWTRGFGPYERCDSGDKFRERRYLRSESTFNNELTVVATVIEHDLGSLEEIQDTVQAAVDVLVGVVETWFDVSDVISNGIADALVWIADVLGLANDQIGPSKGLTFDRGFAERHTGHSTWEGFEYDVSLHFRGNMDGPRRQRGDFWVFFDIRPYP